MRSILSDICLQCQREQHWLAMNPACTSSARKRPLLHGIAICIYYPLRSATNRFNGDTGRPHMLSIIIDDRSGLLRHRTHA